MNALKTKYASIAMEGPTQSPEDICHSSWQNQQMTYMQSHQA